MKGLISELCTKIRFGMSSSIGCMYEHWKLNLLIRKTTLIFGSIVKINTLEFYLMLSLIGVSCSTINRAYFDDCDRFTPVRSRFKFVDGPREYEKETSIRTDGIYLQNDLGVNSNSDTFIESDFWIYIRFLPNGEFHSSSALQSMPDKFNCMLMPSGFNGYWKTLNDSIIRVEYFSPREFNCYIIEDFMIDENGRLVQLRSRIRSFGAMWRKYQNSFYYPIEVENLPDCFPR